MKEKIVLFFIILLSLSACDKAFVNGDLDGMWRLERVVCSDTEIQPQGIYYSFQRHIVMFGRYHDDESAPFLYMGNFSHENGKIAMSGFKEYPGIVDVCDAAALEGLYIYNATGELFDVVLLEKDNMVLATGERVYYFRKW